MPVHTLTSSNSPAPAPPAAPAAPKFPQSLNKQHAALKGIDAEFIDRMYARMVPSRNMTVTWEQIVGLEHVREQVEEMTTLPLLRPDLFTGAKQPPKGFLLFGPPGTGKTMVAKAIASSAMCSFFSVSSSDVMDKMLGNSEKLIKALFAVARGMLPRV